MRPPLRFTTACRRIVVKLGPGRAGRMPRLTPPYARVCLPAEETQPYTADIPLTHEFLAVMLGVQRPGVTLALRNLERCGVIKATRCKITVIYREGLLGLTKARTESRKAR